LIYQLKGLPGFVLSYVNGNGHPSYFSFFPWAGFTLAGITFGYILVDAKERIGEAEFFKRVAVFAICAYAAGSAMSLTSRFEYGFFDYSLTSPHFFLIRLGWVLLILYGAYLWSTTEMSAGWSPLINLGQASLIVYWLHVDIVYGRLFHGFAQALELSGAALQLMWMAPLMLAAASARPLLAQIQMRLGTRPRRLSTA
jgi:fucose 4-O-acetylase-like acetyltransferase